MVAHEFVRRRGDGFLNKSMKRATYDRAQTKGERTAEQCQRIHHAVMRAFAERPSEEVTIELVVRLAEMSKNTLYCHFPGGLEELRALAVERHCSALSDRIAQGISASEHGRALDALVGEMTSLVQDESFAPAFVMAALAAKPATRRAIAVMWMRAHNADHALGFTPHLIELDDAEMFFSMLQGVIGTAMARQHGPERESLLARFVDVYRRVHPLARTSSTPRESSRSRTAVASPVACGA